MSKITKQLDNNVVYISVGQGKFAVVDTADYPKTEGYKWTVYKAGRTFYAQATVRRGGHPTTVKMHRVILGDRCKERTDHRDGNGLNNRRNNIRPATHLQNARNIHAIRAESGYKGVTLGFRCASRPWLASIRVKTKTKFLGYFATKREAAGAYNNAALKYFGEFAFLNKMGGA